MNGYKAPNSYNSSPFNPFDEYDRNGGANDMGFESDVEDVDSFNGDNVSPPVFVDSGVNMDDCDSGYCGFSHAYDGHVDFDVDDVDYGYIELHTTPPYLVPLPGR